MKIIENRASIVLYNFLMSNSFSGAFLLPANICPIVPLIFLASGTDFEFVDIADDQAINRQESLALIATNNYSGILFVHPYGRVFEVYNFYKSLKDVNPNFVIIDDKCLCIPDLLSDSPSPFVDLELFSTGYSKFVELSFGGWGLINDKFRYMSQVRPYRVDYYTQIMNNIQKCLIDKSLFTYEDIPWLDTFSNINSIEYSSDIEKIYDDIVKHKERINAIYSENISSDFMLGEEYNNWRFMIKFDCAVKRKAFIKEVFDNGLFVGTNYPSVAYIFKSQYQKNAEIYSDIIVNLFNDFRVSASEAKNISLIINKYK